MPTLLLAGVFLLACSPLSSPRADAPSTDYILGKVRGDLKKKDSLPFDIRAKADQLARYYDKPTASLIWLEPAKQDELIRAVSEVSTAGLANIGASINRLQNIGQMLRSGDASLLALVELTFSARYLSAVESLYLGRTELYSAKLHRRTLARFIYADRVLELAASKPVPDVLAEIQPKQVDYQAIRSKLVEYVSLQKRGGWPALKPGPDMKQPDAGQRVSDLRARLAITGEIPPSNSDVFDAELEKAVREFQKTHNLPQTGIADRRTVLALNVSVRDRIAQLTANLERWRWFEDFQEDRLVVINVNRDRLEVRERDKGVKLFPIKSNSACEQHPAFNSTIDHVDIDPSYTVPQALAEQYLLPVLQKKPADLGAGLTIFADRDPGDSRSVDWKTFSEGNFPFTVRQVPGPSNLLGSFQLPVKDDNDVSVHGRPAPEPKLPLPRKLWPACVAASDAPGQLLLELGAQDLNMAAVGATSATLTRRIDLAQPIPVIFLYATVWLDETHSLIFGPDPLGLDAALARVLLENNGS